MRGAEEKNAKMSGKKFKRKKMRQMRGWAISKTALVVMACTLSELWPLSAPRATSLGIPLRKI